MEPKLLQCVHEVCIMFCIHGVCVCVFKCFNVYLTFVKILVKLTSKTMNIVRKAVWLEYTIHSHYCEAT